MNGLSASQLAAIPQELKEAVCNALVNLTVARVSGSDFEGRILYGRTPRRSIVSGQLLPRFDPTGLDDETSDIRIAALGMDFHLDAHADDGATVTPRFSVMCAFCRIGPNSQTKPLGWRSISGFVRRSKTQLTIAFTNSESSVSAAGVATPDWPSLNPEQRQRVRSRRSEIQEEVRRQAYREQGITLEQGDEQLLVEDAPVDNAEAPPVPGQVPAANAEAQDAPDDQNARLRIGRLLQRGRTVPYALLDPAPAPPKWRRVDLTFEPFNWPLRADRATLEMEAAAYSLAMRRERFSKSQIGSIRRKVDARFGETFACSRRIWHPSRRGPHFERAQHKFRLASSPAARYRWSRHSDR